MTAKEFCNLTKEEAKEIVHKIVKSSRSEGEIRWRLTEAGFDGEAAAILSHSCGSMFQAMVMVYGPHNEIIA